MCLFCLFACLVLFFEFCFALLLLFLVCLLLFFCLWNNKRTVQISYLEVIVSLTNLINYFLKTERGIITHFKCKIIFNLIPSYFQQVFCEPDFAIPVSRSTLWCIGAYRSSSQMWYLWIAGSRYQTRVRISTHKLMNVYACVCALVL